MIRLTINCDGTRSGQACRGRLPIRHRDLERAIDEAVAAGWTIGHALTMTVEPTFCPSRGHDGDPE